VLLSFAQFERELIGERTRDKIAAARRKGMWTGGVPVLGYDVAPEGGRLIVNAQEAERVQAIFGLYLKDKGLLPVVEELAHRGWRNKRYVTRAGTGRGGGAFTKPSLHSLLKNPLYMGKVRSDGSLHPGQHEAIVDEGTWQRVQSVLRGNGHRRRNGIRRNAHKPKPLLGGLLHCQPCGVAMTQSVTVRGKRRHRYYVCLNAQKNGWASCPTKSVRAQTIEASVVEQLRGLSVAGNGHVPEELAPFGDAWETLSSAERHHAIRQVVERIDYDGPSGTLTAVLRQAPSQDRACGAANHNGNLGERG